MELPSKRKQFQARKMPKKTRRVPVVSCTSNSGGQSFFTRETAQRLQKYTRKQQVNKPSKAMETRKVAVPRCTVVAGKIDLYTGSKEGKGPGEKANPPSDRDPPIKVKILSQNHFPRVVTILRAVAT
jgi:hypothetical protein